MHRRWKWRSAGITIDAMSYKQPPDPRYVGIRVDNNFFDTSLIEEERDAAEQLITLSEALEISIAIPHTVRKELDDPRTPPHVRLNATRLPYTLDTGMSNQSRRSEVVRIMQGNALKSKHVKDATHLYDTSLWQCAYFVTCDNRILRKQSELSALLEGLWVVKPSQLFQIYQDYKNKDAW